MKQNKVEERSKKAGIELTTTEEPQKQKKKDDTKGWFHVDLFVKYEDLKDDECGDDAMDRVQCDLGSADGIIINKCFPQDPKPDASTPTEKR
jgi:hypothetical protein